MKKREGEKEQKEKEKEKEGEENRSPLSFSSCSRARDRIRTSTTFRMLPPEDSASTNFATRAGGKYKQSEQSVSPVNLILKLFYLISRK